MPDPQLKVAIKEIQAVLQKHDIAGIIILASPTHMEYLHHISPTWSCATIQNGNELRIRAKAIDFPDETTHRECLQTTLGMFIGFSDVMRSTRDVFDGITKQVGEKVNFWHRSIHEPHKPEDLP